MNLQKLHQLFTEVNNLSIFFEEIIDEGNIDIPLLQERIEVLEPLSPLEREIKSCIDDYGTVLDQASQALRTIRHQMRSYESTIKSKLESLTRGSVRERCYLTPL